MRGCCRTRTKHNKIRNQTQSYLGRTAAVKEEEKEVVVVSDSGSPIVDQFREQELHDHRLSESQDVRHEGKKAGPLVFVGVNNVFTKPQIPNHAPNGVSVSDQKTSPLPVENAGSLSVPYQIKDVQEKWCIVKPSTPAAKLDDIIQFCCIQIEVDCSAIQVGGMCYNPATNKVSDASVVMNMYYQIAGQFDHDCDFGGSGLIITQDPSVGQCIYQLGE